MSRIDKAAGHIQVAFRDNPALYQSQIAIIILEHISAAELARHIDHYRDGDGQDVIVRGDPPSYLDIDALTAAIKQWMEGE